MSDVAKFSLRSGQQSANKSEKERNCDRNLPIREANTNKLVGEKSVLDLRIISSQWVTPTRHPICYKFFIIKVIHVISYTVHVATRKCSRTALKLPHKEVYQCEHHLGDIDKNESRKDRVEQFESNDVSINKIFVNMQHQVVPSEANFFIRPSPIGWPFRRTVQSY